MASYFERLAALQSASKERGIPNVSWNNGYALYVLTLMHRPRRMLEIGTANGISTLFFAKALEACGGHVDTIERSERDYAEAKQHISEMGMDHVVTAWCADASSKIPTLDGPYDLVFVDAMKRSYREYAEKILPLLAEQGVIIFDDVIKYRHKMEDLFAWIGTQGYHHIVLPTDADDGILILIPHVDPEAHVCLNFSHHY